MRASERASATCTSSSMYAGDVRFRERNVDVRLKIPVLKARAPAQPALRLATALRTALWSGKCMLECSGASFIGAGVLHRAFSERFHVIVRYLRHGLELVIPNRFVASSENLDRKEKKKETRCRSFSASRFNRYGGSEKKEESSSFYFSTSAACKATRSIFSHLANCTLLKKKPNDSVK